MNAFDGGGGPVASEMHAAKSERDDLRALLVEARRVLALPGHPLDLANLLARIDAVLAKGAGDGE